MNADLLTGKEQALEEAIRQLGSVIVAYSGGVDSSLLAYYARKVLGNQALVAIAISASLAQEELEAARLQAQQFRWELIELITNEIENPAYTRNDEMRCYYCKHTLFTELEQLAGKRNIRHIAYGANIDDKKDYRPGHKAAQEFNIVSPLQHAGLSKDDIRALAQNAGLPSWDRPQAACLASRFPTFQPVTVSGLAIVEKSEKYLHSLGLKQVRVRHFDRTAKVEIDQQELTRVLDDAPLQSDIVNTLKGYGYNEVIIDPNGYRRGSANTFLGTGNS